MPPFDIRTLALNEVLGNFLPLVLIQPFQGICFKVLVEQAQQGLELFVFAAVGSRREQKQMLGWFFGNVMQQVVALLLAGSACPCWFRTGVGLVYDHEVRGNRSKTSAAACRS